MASNAEKIVARYGDGAREEGRSSGDRGDYVMEYRHTKRILDRYIATESSILELGCGTGYYGMYLAGRCRSYTGVDIAPGNILRFREKIRAGSLLNVDAFVGDATDLDAIPGDSFDVVLALGPIYHLPPAEQEFVFAESRRVCRHGGIVLFAYINKVGVYLDLCIGKPTSYPNRRKNQSILTDGIDDTRDNIYWFTMPEDMEARAGRHGLAVLENLGVDFVLIPEMANPPAENKAAWEELVAFMSQRPSCTGFSNHAVLVCRNG